MTIFAIDETCWAVGNLTSSEYLGKIEDILDYVEVLTSAGHDTVFSDDLFNMALCLDLTFYDLYDTTSPVSIPRHVQERIAVIFGRLGTWQDLEFDWPDGFDVSVEGQSLEFAPTIAWAHARSSEGEKSNVPCIVHSLSRASGHFSISLNDRPAKVWMLSRETETQGYFRWTIVNATRSANEMEKYLSDAYPQLAFVTGALAGISTMSKPYVHMVEDINVHLSALCDHGERIFRGLWQQAPSEFGSLHVNLSDENGNVKQNKVCQRERTRNFGGQDLIFWWHTKIRPDRDRIHFCPDLVSEGGRIIVGIFCYHLVC